MRIELITSVSDADWISLRSQLWPDVLEEDHFPEMKVFVADPLKYRQIKALSDDGKAIGLLEGSIRSEYVNGAQHSPCGYLEGLFVVGDQRKRGVAAKMVGEMCRWFKDRDCSEVISDTDPENLVSVATHEKLGFVETERAVFFRKQLS